MNYVIIIFAAATIIAGIIIVINPETIFGLLRRKLDAIGLHIIAVFMRVILGIALIVYAIKSRYPTAILIIGCISIVAASVLGIMGRTNFKRLMSWALGVAPIFGRIGGLLAILFGGFLIHAVV